MKKMLSIVLGAVVVVAIAVGAYVLGGNASKQNSEQSSKNTTSAKTIKKQVKTSVVKSHKSESSEKTSESSSTSVTQESSSSQVDQNQLQETEFDNGLLNDDMAMKAVVYYSVMTGANQNDKMWVAFKDMIQNPSQYGNVQVSVNGAGTGIELTSRAMGGVNVSWPTISWTWGEKAQGTTGQPDFVAKGQNNQMSFSKQDVVNYVNENGGKNILNSFTLNTGSAN